MHNADRLAVFGNQGIDFTASNAVFASAGAFQCQCAINETLIKPFGLCHLLRIIGVKHEANVKISISGVANDGSRQKR